MQQIRCPRCGEVFQVDESGYAAIVKQVRDHEFAEELKSREESLRREKETAVQLAVTRAQAGREDEIRTLREQLQQLQADRDAQLQKLQADQAARLQKLEADRAAEIQKLQADRDLERQRLQAERDAQLRDLQARGEAQLAQKEQEITKLAGERELEQARHAAEVEKATREKEEEILQLKNAVELEKNRAALQEKNAQEAFAAELKRKDEEIAYYKDFNARHATKMIGESLEQHCETEFNRIRAAAFPNAYFEKDNDARTGSKGDFIFREVTPDGVEVVSIMFEMKNEMSETASKHKNEDFFKELDKDRREKNCEYAVLVSLLEADSELYNAGIVDVSYRYEKMYVVRPQFFIPIITLLRNAAQGALAYKQELAVVRSQNLDITNFEEDMNRFKADFTYNVELAGRKFSTAIDEIDKTIAHLQKTREALVSSDRNLQIAGRKVGDLSIKRLTRKNPTMREKFEEARRAKEAEGADEHA